MLSFRQFLAVMHGRRLEIMVVWLGIVLAVAVVSLLLPKRYMATAAVAIDIAAPELFNTTNAINAGWVPSYVTTQVDVLMSEVVALKAIDTLGLDRDAKRREAWLAATGGQGDFRSWIAAELHKKLDVKTTLQSNAVYVAFTAPSPELAADVANAIVRGYIATTVEMKVQPTRQFADLFDSRSKKLRDELEAAKARLSAYQRTHGILAKDERFDVESARLNELNMQQTALQALVADSASRLFQTREDPTHSPEVMGNSMVAGLTVDLNRQQARLQELTTRLGDEHPQVVETRASIAELRRRLAAASSQVSGGVASIDAVNRSRLARVEAALAEQRGKVLALKEARDKIDVLVREVESAQKAYDVVLSRASQTSLESQNTQTNVTVLKQASKPAKPSSPLLGLNLAIALVVGAIAAVGIAVMREFLDRRVRTHEDVEADLKVVMLGELADSTPAGQRRLLPWPRAGVALLRS